MELTKRVEEEQDIPQGNSSYQTLRNNTIHNAESNKIPFLYFYVTDDDEKPGPGCQTKRSVDEGEVHRVRKYLIFVLPCLLPTLLFSVGVIQQPSYLVTGNYIACKGK